GESVVGGDRARVASGGGGLRSFGGRALAGPLAGLARAGQHCPSGLYKPARHGAGDARLCRARGEAASAEIRGRCPTVSTVRSGGWGHSPQERAKAASEEAKKAVGGLRRRGGQYLQSLPGRGPVVFAKAKMPTAITSHQAQLWAN